MRVALLAGFSYPVRVVVALRFDRAYQNGLIVWVEPSEWKPSTDLWSTSLGQRILLLCQRGAQEILILTGTPHLFDVFETAIAHPPPGLTARLTVVPMNPHHPAAVKRRITQLLGPQWLEPRLTAELVSAFTGDKPLLCVGELGHPNGFLKTIKHAGLNEKELAVKEMRYVFKTRGSYVAELQRESASSSMLLYASSGLGSLSESVLRAYSGRVYSGSTALDALVAFRRAIVAAQQNSELASGLAMQRALMPSIIPGLPGFEASSRWQPAKQLAGDFYDVFPLAGDFAGVLIADVSGKGLPAAVLAANLHGTIRSLAPYYESPGLLLAAVNDRLCRAGVNKYATLVYAVANCATGELVYSNAGHNPPFILTAAGETILLDQGGFPVGLISSALYVDGHVALRPSDWFVAYTDGLTEAMNADQQEFGDHRVVLAARDAVALTPAAMVDAILKAAQDFAEYEFEDDLTILAFRRQGIRGSSPSTKRAE